MSTPTVGEYPPQIHIKPALDVQKMENVQTCLNFLEHYDVSINGIAAEGEREINLIQVRTEKDSKQIPMSPQTALLRTSHSPERL